MRYIDRNSVLASNDETESSQHDGLAGRDIEIFLNFTSFSDHLLRQAPPQEVVSSQALMEHGQGQAMNANLNDGNDDDEDSLFVSNSPRYTGGNTSIASGAVMGNDEGSGGIHGGSGAIRSGTRTRPTTRREYERRPYVWHDGGMRANEPRIAEKMDYQTPQCRHIRATRNKIYKSAEYVVESDEDGETDDAEVDDN